MLDIFVKYSIGLYDIKEQKKGTSIQTNEKYNLVHRVCIRDMDKITLAIVVWFLASANVGYWQLPHKI